MHFSQFVVDYPRLPDPGPGKVLLHLLCSDSQLTSFKLCTFEIEQVLGIMLDLTNPGEVSV